jgi:glycosyltransferase involved in cell wall biosynthesis
LSSSRYESFGYMVAEALAMARPVVASDVTGTRDIMSGPLQEWLYPPGDTEQAAGLVHALLSEQASAQGVGAHGRELIKHRFNRDAMTKALDVVYQKAVSA